MDTSHERDLMALYVIMQAFSLVGKLEYISDFFEKCYVRNDNMVRSRLLVEFSFYIHAR